METRLFSARLFSLVLALCGACGAGAADFRVSETTSASAAMAACASADRMENVLGGVVK